MSKWITAYFETGGAAHTGLTPIVTIYDLSDDSVDVNAQSMTEVANGWYKYDFAGYDETKYYVGITNSQSGASDNQIIPIELSPPAKDHLFADGIVRVDTDGTNSTEWPYGSASYATTTIANAKVIADARGLRDIRVKGTHTLTADMEAYNFVGGMLIDITEVITLGGFSTEHSSFERLIISGVSGNAALISDATTFIDCYLYGVTNLNGWVSRGRVEGVCSLRDTGYSTFNNVLFGSGLACTLTLQAPTRCDIDSMSGELTLSGMDGGVCSVSMSPGSRLTIDNTCTAGTITVTGVGHVTDNSAGATVTIRIAEADLVQIKSVPVTGTGTAADPWGP